MSALSLDCRQSLANSKVSVHRKNDSVKVDTLNCSDLVSFLSCLSPNKPGKSERGALTVTLTALGGCQFFLNLQQLKQQ